MSAELPETLFHPLAARIAEVSGIRVPVAKRWLLASRVAERMKAENVADVGAYVTRVLARGGEVELGRLIEAVRVGETQFFRHQGQLRAIRRVALPEIVARREAEGQMTVRVWSAGCATGEEAYTLAMLLEEMLPAEDGWKHEVLATDLSEVALEKAAAARYPASAAAGVPKEIAAWAIEPAGDRIAVAPRIRRTVRFEQQNLLDVVYPRGFDLIFCRNVLIYFDRTTQQDVIRRLARSLLPGGYLALGYAERLADEIATLAPMRTEDGVLYRRTDARASNPPARPRKSRTPPAGIRRSRTGPVPAEPRRSRPPTPARAIHRDTVPTPTPALRGRVEGDEGAREAQTVAGRLLCAEGDPRLDLRELRFADDGVARVLARAAAALAAQGRTLHVLAVSPGTVRWVERHGIAPPAVIDRAEAG